ncbi:MAG: DUF1778 domain-containing protein [Alphaproteobacteria bacterium]
MPESRTAIQLRVPTSDLSLIDQAAKVKRVTRTDLMVQASTAYAKEVLVDRQEFAWEEFELRAFESALEASNRTNTEVVNILKKLS